MLFSVAACQSADEEENAQASELVTENENEQPENDQNTQQEQEQEQNQTPPADEQNNNSQTEPEKEDKTPPLSESGKYKVTFNLGFDNKTQTENTDGKVTEFTPERAGYKFDGWYDGNTKFDFSKEITGDIKLTAKWSLETYTITYVGDNLPKGNPTSYTVPQSDIKLASPELLFKVFIGWEISNGQKTVASSAIPAGMTGNLTLKPMYSVTDFKLGKYEQDDNTDNGKEDIIWVKLKEENGKALLITKELIDAKTFDDAGGAAVNWSNCTLRNWLNGSFYKYSFSDEEKAAIFETVVTTVDDAQTTTSNDFVFVLSKQEVQEVMKTYADRHAKPTPVAKKNGSLEGQKGGWWWLRNKNSIAGAAVCDDTGIFNTVTGYNTKLTTIGARPCVWVDSSKLK